MSTAQYPGIYLYRRIVQAKLFIDNHFADSIDLENIADEAYFSKYHFIRLFKKVYGKTPHQYLIHVRIEKARQFLRMNKSVTDACYLVGFESVSSFSGLFRRLAGSSPSAFLKHQQLVKKEISATPLKFIPGCFARQTGWLKNSNFKEVVL